MAMNGLRSTCLLRQTLQQSSGCSLRFTNFGVAQPALRRCLYVRSVPPSLLRKHLPCTSSPIVNQLRRESNATPAPVASRETSNESTADEIAARKAQEPAYELTFTCKQCDHRSAHRVTKQAYHHGTTLITCPGCKNRHLISDHLKIFSDKGVTLEDILKEKGQYLRKGRLGEDGDIEFYDDGDAKPRTTHQGSC